MMFRRMQLVAAIGLVGVLARWPLASAAAAANTTPTCTVMTLEAKGGISPDDASFLSDRFEVELGRLGSYAMLSRDNMTKILEAQEYSLMCGGAECAIEAGRLLAIQYVVFGSIGRLGQTYSVNVSLANVESGVVEKRASHDVKGDIDLLLTSGMENAARKLQGLDAVSLPADPAHPTTSAVWTNSLGMEFRAVPGLSVLFSIWETRVQDYAPFSATRRPSALAPHSGRTELHPVVNVSWRAANAFCVWLSEKERREGVIPADAAYRLPTDSEWSVAVGLGAESGPTPAEKDGKVHARYPWGTQWPPPSGVGNYAQTRDTYSRAAPVGRFPPNSFGLYDMGGNVWEWCSDEYRPLWGVVLRGGSYSVIDERAMLSSCRISRSRDSTGDDIGFRCVLARGAP